jgi:hypothetical protein
MQVPPKLSLSIPRETGVRGFGAAARSRTLLVPTLRYRSTIDCLLVHSFVYSLVHRFDSSRTAVDQPPSHGSSTASSAPREELWQVRAKNDYALRSSRKGTLSKKTAGNLDHCDHRGGEIRNDWLPAAAGEEGNRGEEKCPHRRRTEEVGSSDSADRVLVARRASRQGLVPCASRPRRARSVCLISDAGEYPFFSSSACGR